MSEKSKSLKVSEAARAADLSVSTLHYYEKIGLIETPLRSQKGYRLYGQNTLERLDFIKKAKTLGFQLDEIRRIIDESKSGECCQSVRQLVQKRLAEVDEQIIEMKRFRSDLAAFINNSEKTETSDAVICGLIENSGISSKQN